MANPPYHQTLRPVEELATAICALSNIRYHNKQGIHEDNFPMAEDDLQKHIGLRDGLALLLIFQEKTEVAATSFEIKTDGIHILWAKNDPSPPSTNQQSYIDGLKLRFSQLSKLDNILQEVVSNNGCKSKVVNRCRRAAKELPSLGAPYTTNRLQISPTITAYGPLQLSLREQGMIGETTSLEAGLDWLVKSLLGITKTSQLATICDVIAIAHIATQTKSSIGSFTSVYRLKKLAEYRLACEEILNALSRVPEKIRRNIHIRQVATPNPRRVVVPRLTIDSLNRWHYHYPRIDKVGDFDEEVLPFYPQATPGPAGRDEDQIINSSQHCELTLALHILDSKIPAGMRDKPVKVGCSKATCYWCRVFIYYLNQHHSHRSGNKIVVRPTRGKMFNGWLLPGTADEVEKNFLNHVGMMMQKVFTKLEDAPRRRSDSQPLPDAFPPAAKRKFGRGPVI